MSAEVLYVGGRNHFVRYSDGRVEYRHDGMNGWIYREGQPCEYECLSGWLPCIVDSQGDVPTPAHYYEG
jgi:hypothetical protein